jgi:hypothetical protein
MQNSSRKQFSLTSFFLFFEEIFPLQFVTCIPIKFLFLFLFLFLQIKILRIKEARVHAPASQVWPAAHKGVWPPGVRRSSTRLATISRLAK